MDSCVNFGKSVDLRNSKTTIEEIKCGECGFPMIQRTSKYGIFYGCSRFPECRGAHGAHQKSGKPLGIPANSETKKFRIQAHEEFDKLWIDGDMNRKEAYRWMEKTLNLSKKEAHISRMDIDTCKRLIEAIRNKLLEQ